MYSSALLVRFFINTTVTRLVVAGLLLISMPSLMADWQDDVGYQFLKDTLGPSLPLGTGVQVSQIEASESGTTLKYAPQAGTGSFNGTGFHYTGKTFTIQSGATTASGHAGTVARFFYGNNTNPASGPASIAPGVTSIHNYVAGHPASTTSFLDQLGSGSTPPYIETSRVQSHAWISSSTNSGGSAENDILRRLDLAIDRDGFLAVTGMNNLASSSMPYLIGAGYNALGVGLSNGGHSHGPIRSGLDGQGRIKPEIVAPESATSWATGIVASAGTMLYQTLLDHFPSVPQARQSLLIRAALLAGATKEEFSVWDRKKSRPLDDRYGLGELNAAHSYRILAAGEQNPGPIPHDGWDLESISSGQIKAYTLVIPPGGFADQLSIIVTWNRRLELVTNGPPSGLGVFPLPLTDINLTLKDSAGTILDQSNGTTYNYEHIYALNLPAGTYLIEVSSDAPETYALTWRAQIGSGPKTQVVFDDNANSTTLHFSDLDPLATYHVESSLNYSSWNIEPTSTFSPTGSTSSWADPAGIVVPAPKFYRLCWDIPSAPP